MENKLLIAFCCFAMDSHERYCIELITEDNLEAYVKYALTKMCGFNELIEYKKTFSGHKINSSYLVYEATVGNDVLDDIYDEKFIVHYFDVSGKPNKFLNYTSSKEIRELLKRD